MEAEANDAANDILNSYASIFSDSSDSQKSAAKKDGRHIAAASVNTRGRNTLLPKPGKDPLHDERKTWQVLGVDGPVMAVPQEYSKRQSIRNHKDMASDPKPRMPSYVARAEAELAHADYVRRHKVSELLPPAEDMRSVVKEHVAAPRKKQVRKDWVQLAAKSPLRRIPSGASVEKLVQNAVARALANQKVKAVSARDTLAWAKYLARARAERIALASTPSVSPVREQQLSVLSKRADQAQQHLVSMTQESDSIVASQPPQGVVYAPQPRKAEGARSSAYETMLRQGVLPKSEHTSGEPARVPAAAHGDSRSPFAAEEQHLHQEIDSIFGAPGQSTRSAEKNRQAVKNAPEKPAVSRGAPAVAAKVVKYDTKHAQQVATLQRLTSQIDDLVRKGAERLELSKLQEEVKHLREVEELHRLQSQLKAMRQRLRQLNQVKQAQNVAAKEMSQRWHESWVTPMLAAANASAEANDTAANDTKPAAPADMVRVCDPFGCRDVPIARPAAPPPPPEFAPGNGSSSKDWLAKVVDEPDIWKTLLPWGSWDRSLEPEVHLDENGTIQADHDDPHGRLSPHNPYQDEAVYPDGARHRSEAAYGIRNTLGEGLFDDNIVVAQPGFNAGTGRHIRSQQAADWDRNWGSQVVKGDKVLVN